MQTVQETYRGVGGVKGTHRVVTAPRGGAMMESYGHLGPGPGRTKGESSVNGPEWVQGPFGNHCHKHDKIREGTRETNILTSLISPTILFPAAASKIQPEARGQWSLGQKIHRNYYPLAHSIEQGTGVQRMNLTGWRRGQMEDNLQRNLWNISCDIWVSHSNITFNAGFEDRIVGKIIFFLLMYVYQTQWMSLVIFSFS